MERNSYAGSSGSNGYAGYGNRWVDIGAIPGTMTPTGADPFSANTNQMSGVGYDQRGNQTQYNPFTVTYDAENRAVTVTSPQNQNGSAQYVYDGEGRRLKKLVTTITAQNTTTSITWYAYDASGDLAAEYTSGGSSETTTKYLIPDHLGSTRAVMTSAGAVEKRYDYRPFGQEIGAGLSGRTGKYSTVVYPGPGDGQSFKYTGKERDAETGLDYFGAKPLGCG